eukprot:2387619-Pyramimonas_sp.AAC.1
MPSALASPRGVIASVEDLHWRSSAESGWAPMPGPAPLQVRGEEGREDQRARVEAEEEVAEAEEVVLEGLSAANNAACV